MNTNEPLISGNPLPEDDEIMVALRRSALMVRTAYDLLSNDTSLGTRRVVEDLLDTLKADHSDLARKYKYRWDAATEGLIDG